MTRIAELVIIYTMGAACALVVTGMMYLAATDALRRRRDTRDRRARTAWQQQIPGLERIPLCTACRVVVTSAGAERIPCQWHADMASVAIERRVTS